MKRKKNRVWETPRDAPEYIGDIIAGIAQAFDAVK